MFSKLWSRISGFHWKPSPDFLAQAAHALLGAFLTVLPLALGLPWWSSFIGAALGFTYMGVKEFTFDLWVERDTKADGWRDIRFYSYGAGGAGALIILSLIWR